MVRYDNAGRVASVKSSAADKFSKIPIPYGGIIINTGDGLLYLIQVVEDAAFIIIEKCIDHVHV